VGRSNAIPAAGIRRRQAKGAGVRKAIMAGAAVTVGGSTRDRGCSNGDERARGPSISSFITNRDQREPKPLQRDRHRRLHGRRHGPLAIGQAGHGSLLGGTITITVKPGNPRAPRTKALLADIRRFREVHDRERHEGLQGDQRNRASSPSSSPVSDPSSRASAHRMLMQSRIRAIITANGPVSLP